MNLLNPIAPNELPAEALLARLRSRRAALQRSHAGHDEEALKPELPLQSVIDWVYLHLERRLRRQLAPYLEILAMRQLIHALRHRMAGDPAPLSLSRSRLLNPALVRLVQAEREPAQMIGHLERALAESFRFASRLSQTYLQQGPGGVEMQLGNGILRHGLASARIATVKWLVGYLIDMRNLLTVLKLWRWQVRRPPEMISGGRLHTETLLRLWRKQDRRLLLSLAGQIAGQRIEQEHALQVERELLNGLSRRLRRAGRDPLSVAVILDYLWCCQLVAHNQALQHAVGTERHELLAEALLT